MTTFVCISDTHNSHEKISVPKADIVIHAGDMTGVGTTKQIREFCEWYGKLPHKHKILIAGNHDWGFEKDYRKHKQICIDNGIIYLQDSSCEIDGIKFHGSPQTPEFCSWAFNCWRTEKQEELNYGRYGPQYVWIGKFWKMIPEDTDVLVTHGPPYEILDSVYGKNVGCEELLKKVKEVNPKYHVFGHIHCDVGELIEDETTFINAACLGEDYKPNNQEIKVYTI